MFNIFISGFSGKTGSVLLNYMRSLGYIYTYKLSFSFLNKFSINQNSFVIDFSHSSNLNTLLKIIVLYGCKLIVGTTGYNSYQIKLLKKISKFTVVFISSNFNNTFFIFLKLIRFIKKLIRNKLNTVLIETHNVNKKDFPSGSSKYICKILKSCPVFSLRYGNKIGTHTVKFFDDYNHITVKHNCVNRNGFLNMLPYVIKYLSKYSNGFFVFKV